MNSKTEQAFRLDFSDARAAYDEFVSSWWKKARERKLSKEGSFSWVGKPMPGSGEQDGRTEESAAPTVVSEPEVTRSEKPVEDREDPGSSTQEGTDQHQTTGPTEEMMVEDSPEESSLRRRRVDGELPGAAEGQQPSVSSSLNLSQSTSGETQGLQFGSLLIETPAPSVATSVSEVINPLMDSQRRTEETFTTEPSDKNQILAERNAAAPRRMNEKDSSETGKPPDPEREASPLRPPGGNSASSVENLPTSGEFRTVSIDNSAAGEQQVSLDETDIEGDRSGEVNYLEGQ